MHGTRDEVVASPPPFEIVLRGFDRKQVVDHVNALKARVATLGAERDAARQRAADLEDSLEQVRREAAEATRQVDRLRGEAKAAATEVDRLQRSPVAGASARIQRMLQMAEDEAAELQTSVERETSSLRESARAETDQLLAETRQLCERLEAESARRREAAEAESAGRRYRAEQQSEQDITSRQAEIETWASDYQTRSIAALYSLLQIVGERLNSRVVKVNRQVDAARKLRSEVTDQLSVLQRLLTEALGVVDQPTPAEPPERTEPTEHNKPPERTEPAEPVEPAEPTEPIRKKKPAAQPAGGAGRSRGGPGSTRRMERPGQAGWPQQADQPTARFGLHP